MRPVLHDEDAENPAAPQDRHAHQGLIDLLAGLGAEDEIRMVLRVGQGQRPGPGRDHADQALADPQPGVMHRRFLQALGGEQFQQVAGAPDVDRAHLRIQADGELADDPVQALLGRARARHDIADTRQQLTWRHLGSGLCHGQIPF